MLRISEEFYQLIERFNYNKIAKELIRLSMKDYYNTKSDYNFIAISDNNKFINFLPSSKVDDLILKTKNYSVNSVRNLTHSDENDHIFEYLGYNKNCEYWYPREGHKGTIHGEITSEKTGNTYVLFKSLENDRYSVINKEALNESKVDLFNYSKNKLKVGRFIQHLFEQNDIKFKQTQIEKFVNLYKSTFDILNDKFSLFEIVDGSDISYWYKANNYEYKNGTLGSSCMSESDRLLFEIYEKNKNCKMIILKSNKGIIKDGKILSDKIVARALLWDAKIINGDDIRNITLMDRIYTNNDSDVNVFIQYAQENGWWYKSEQNFYPETSITNGEELFEFNSNSKRLEVDIENIYFKKYPYIDTLCYVMDEKTLSNNYIIDSEKEVCHGFRCTDGSYETYDDEYSIEKILGDD